MSVAALDAPYQAHSETSIAAAAAAEERSPTQRARVFNAILRAGVHGLTDEEIQRVLKMNPSTERPRRIELTRLRLVQKSEATRRTASGRQAAVWVAVPTARQLQLPGGIS